VGRLLGRFLSIYHDDAGTITPAIERMADGIISKPINHEQLHQTIKAVLARCRNQP
jgi:DNA-binding NarL/FixJ family response regulator